MMDLKMVKKYLSFKGMLQNKGISMPKHQIKAYMNLFAYLDYVTNNRYTEQQLFELYCALGDIAEGKFPKTAIIKSSNDIIPTLVRIMEEIPLTKGRLSSEQKLRIAFCEKAITGVQEQPEGVRFDWFDTVETAEETFTFFREKMPIWFKETERKKIDTNAYGMSLKNPIQTTSVQAAYFYLDRLKYNGNPVLYEREGSFRGENHIVDKYNIYAIKEPSQNRPEYLCDIYIDSYCETEPEIAPDGFTF